MEHIPYVKTARVDMRVSVVGDAMPTLDWLVGSVHVNPVDASTLYFEQFVGLNGDVATFDIRVSSDDPVPDDEQDEPEIYPMDMVGPRIRWLVGQTIQNVQFLELVETDGFEWQEVDDSNVGLAIG